MQRNGSLSEPKLDLQKGGEFSDFICELLPSEMLNLGGSASWYF